jgi:hypothetical protein
MNIESLTLQLESDYMDGEKVKTRKTTFSGLRPDAADDKLHEMGHAVAELMSAQPTAMYAIKRELLVAGAKE